MLVIIENWRIGLTTVASKKMLYSAESRIENPKSRIENGPCQAGSGGNFPSDRFNASTLIPSKYPPEIAGF